MKLIWDVQHKDNKSQYLVFSGMPQNSYVKSLGNFLLFFSFEICSPVFVTHLQSSPITSIIYN